MSARSLKLHCDPCGFAGTVQSVVLHSFLRPLSRVLALLPSPSQQRHADPPGPLRSLNPAIEEQAINRIHRLGQTKQTTVYRFVVSTTRKGGLFSVGNSAFLL